ncbi:AraC family transcriptional regulator [Chitinophaga pinensis]|uniref:Transcriptional regulator, AraC family n=1 Tax=Chitinophaga pinensis (strain ATCC 43595 / DSM 2588 / LMG 13176 / NBRC 15968 / NCIMB 11800 / UQM 2034) TaxID=485918 RepID=A0A979G491_CHIPD|nr:helix-turn-helix transcriptional regulator [Chitinophaga pinensis]ACU60436.1 transcriptional regulator, AraC family [Chitinophaga pinensis DSM 2588]
MRKTNKSIPVNHFDDTYNSGMSIEKIFIKNLRSLEELAEVEDIDTIEGIAEAHRHDRHSFYLVEGGTLSMDIDFEHYKIKPSSIMYMHPDQVHRTMEFKNVTVVSLAINNENLHSEYLQLLEDITPVKPLVLKKETFDTIAEAAALFIQLSKRDYNKVYHTLLKDCCNALVGLIIGQYLEQSKPADKLSRFEIVTQSFRKLLDRTFTTVKRPAEYAQQLNLSTPYLNECVRNTTGYSVSYHIQQRVILEAKRLLYHSDRSVKEIATILGYDDYPYFSRLFTKVTGMTPLAFRNKNLD